MSRIPVIIIGNGGHAHVIFDTLKMNGINVLGITGVNVTDISDVARYLGQDQSIHSYSCDSVVLANGIGSIGNASRREEIFNIFSKKSYRFITVKHQNAIISSNVTLGQGSQIMAGAVLQARSKIGDNVIINTGARIDHDCTIGNHSHIAPGAVLCGQVRVGNRVHIGAGATIIQDITIGDNCIIGAGAVVIRDIPANKKVFGVPGKIHGEI